MTERSVLTTLYRGLCQVCPQCGKAPVYTKYLKVKLACDNCHLDFNTIRSDDAPAYFTIAILGHLVVPFICWVEVTYHLEMWQHIVFWLPLTTVGVLSFLPRVKGVVMAVQWLTKVSSR